MRMIGPIFADQSSIIDMLVVVHDFDSEAILPGYPRYAEHTERLHRHQWKVKNSSLPATHERSATQAHLSLIGYYGARMTKPLAL